MSTVQEEWRPVKDWEGLYEVSCFGNVRSVDRYVRAKLGSTKLARGQSIRLQGSHDGYSVVRLKRSGLHKLLRVHRIALIAFVSPPPFADAQVNHIDGNKKNNVVSNLEWVTKSENMKHAYRTGLQLPQRGEQHSHAKLSERQVIEIRDRYSRGETTTQLALAFGIRRRSMSDVVRRVTWSHVA